ncbi:MULTISPECIES: HEAT repeat domain-containing protein [unclassified Streptomyces]|uniref:HEAT repeat domain-containing protein n=1 Tax=unclassified Streptomyces TaxID=2593676 RepID=UPI00224C959C|nr:HEAT repeat domain-containing protein [Streptomyces sp. NBC_00047]MCX5606359.1 HEAT repeat domain-containing protein [Streptomyces sp. NBC_00047]
MHISEIGLCGGHSASGVRVDDHARTTVPRLYAAGDLASVPHNYMIGAFVFGDLAGADASRHTAYEGVLPADQLAAAHELVYRPLRNPDGPPQPQVEYKLRRFVNDYVAPPKTGAKLSLAVEAFDRMTGEIAEMGATTAHELMRCAEVSFIRDCAEMAARSSLARTESRWGLYHERLDHPERDDAGWLYHLDLRKSATGAMEFTARPVEPYLVPVDGFAPAGGPSRHLGEVALTPVATAGPREAAPAARTPALPVPDPALAPGSSPGASPRIVELLALAEESPDLAALTPYLADPDPSVRAAAVAALGETVPEGAGPALAARLGDTAPAVRAAAAAALRELVEVLPGEPELGAGLRAALAVPDPAVRSAALEALRALRLGDAELYAASLADADPEVRIHAVRGLVAVDAVPALATAAADPAREVRVAVARGLAAVHAPAPAPLDPLLADPDPLVRGAALAALASVGCPDGYARTAVAALADAAWQVRAGAAAGLSAAATSAAVPALAEALADANADVRKAAVLSLLAHRDTAEARTALATAVTDPDADVRAYAARA